MKNNIKRETNKSRKKITYSQDTPVRTLILSGLKSRHFSPLIERVLAGVTCDEEDESHVLIGNGKN